MAKIENFRFWCQKVLPLVYDNSLSYYELLCKVVNYLNNTIQAVNENTADVAQMRQELNQFEEFINNYFDNLDVQQEINNKLDKMASDGSLTTLLQPFLDEFRNYYSEALADHETDINTLSERIDNIVALPDGSTTADAELTDIRTAFNAVKYPSAGAAVRAQASELNNLIVDNYAGEVYIPVVRGYYGRNSETGKLQKDVTAAVVAVRMRSETDIFPYVKEGTHITTVSPLRFKLAYTDAANNVLQLTDYVTELTVPAQINGSDYYGLYIDFSHADNSEVTESEVNSNLFVYQYDGEPKIIRGTVFAWVSNNTFHLRSSAQARISYRGKVGSIADFDYELPDNSAYYLVYEEGTGMNLVRYSEFTRNYFPLATVYPRTVYTSNPGIVANRLPMMNITYRENVPFFINNKRLGYNVMPSTVIMTTGTNMKYKDTFKFTNGVGAIYRYNEGITVPLNNFTIRKNETVLSDEKILMVGDSIFNRGWIQRRLKEYAPDITFLGTKQTGVGIGVTDYACEAYPGATAYNMIAEGGTHSSINGNYNRYVTEDLNGVVPDIVIIEFGLNESDAAAYFNNVSWLINAIKDYNTEHSTNTAVYVLIPFERALSVPTGRNYNLAYTQIVAGRQCTLNAFDFTDCTLIPTHMIFDDEYDYTHGTLEYAYGKEIDVVTDFVHPSESVGFLKLADMIYSYLEG